MPQASDALRNWARNKFGSLDDWPVQSWLHAQNIKITRQFEILIKLDRRYTYEENQAIDFLVHEWDYTVKQEPTDAQR